MHTTPEPKPRSRATRTRRLGTRRASGSGTLILSLAAFGLFTTPAHPAAARLPFDDVLTAPADLLDTIEDTLWELTDELGIRHQVVDMVVVGSFAYGLARLEDDDDPSDIDLIVYVRELSPDGLGYRAAHQHFRDLAHRYEDLLAERLGTTLEVDIKPDTRDVRDHIADPDWIGYSLIQRRAYNRADGSKRWVRGQFFEDVFYVFERAEFREFAAMLRRERRPVILVRENDQVVYYDRQAWERGNKIELIRSRHKRPRTSNTTAEK